MAELEAEIPTTRSVRLVAVAPVAALGLCGTWNYFAWQMIPVEAALRGAEAQSRALFWANDLPFWLFGLPVILTGGLALIRAIGSRQGWLCLILVLYYVPMLTLTLLACLAFTPFKPFA